MPFAIVTVILILDQATKFLVTQRFGLHESYPLLPGVFHLTLVHNRGAAFGIMKDQLPFFILTALIAVVIIVNDLRRPGQNRVKSAALSLILAGALGNLIDRVWLGYVVDFLDFRIWPVFNVADSAITVGAVILAIGILRERVESKK